MFIFWLHKSRGVYITKNKQEQLIDPRDLVRLQSCGCRAFVVQFSCLSEFRYAPPDLCPSGPMPHRLTLEFTGVSVDAGYAFSNGAECFPWNGVG